MLTFGPGLVINLEHRQVRGRWTLGLAWPWPSLGEVGPLPSGETKPLQHYTSTIMTTYFTNACNMRFNLADL